MFDFTQPIDITKVNEAKIKYEDKIRTILMNSAGEVLQHATAVPGITGAQKIRTAKGGAVLKKYNGTFSGNGNLGNITARLLEVFPIVAEMLDEPERYRKTYLEDVPGALRQELPFELWLLNRGIELASLDLWKILFTAERDENSTPALGAGDAFNGWGTILEAEKTAENITAELGNLYATGAFTTDDCGDQLLAMWRHMPQTFREQKKNVKLFISADVADMYDDWRIKRGHIVIGQTEEVSTTFLLGSNHKCEIVRLGNLPDKSQFALLTTKENILYGYDKDSDMKNMIPFFHDPYHFAAAMKFVFGCEFASIDPSELLVNDQALTPTTSSEPSQGENQGETQGENQEPTEPTNP